MIGSASEKIAVISIINSKLLLYGDPNIAFYLFYFSYFNCKVSTCRIFFFYCVFLKKFIQYWINHKYILTSLTFLASKMDLTTLLTQPVSILKDKCMEGRHELFVFQLLDSFSQNVSFWGCNIFSHLLPIQSTYFFLCSVYA